MAGPVGLGAVVIGKAHGARVIGVDCMPDEYCFCTSAQSCYSRGCDLFLTPIERGYFVEVLVTVQGVSLSQIHPVLDGRNRPIFEPTSFDINTSIQRCLVKAIALHGLGLYVYAGEDLPNGEEPPKAKVTPISSVKTITVGQQRYLQRLLEEAGWDEQRLLDYFSIASVEELPMSEFDRALAALKKAKRRAA